MSYSIQFAVDFVRDRAFRRKMWTEAIEQLGLARLGPPMEIDPDGRLVNDRPKEINIVLRPPVIQSDKTRAVDDLKHGLVSVAPSILRL